jgi:hypothetical protein
MYKSTKKAFSFVLPNKLLSAVTTKLYWYLNRVSGYRLNTEDTYLSRRKYKTKPLLRRTSSNQNFYTLQYIRKRQIDFALNSSGGINKYSERNTAFSNIMPLKTFKKFLKKSKVKSWYSCFYNLNMGLFNFLYKYNLGISRHMMYSSIANGLVLINNIKFNFQRKLVYNDILQINRNLLGLRRSWQSWGISQSWKY